MDSLEELLKHRKNNEPPQIAAIKQYVKTTYQRDCTVQLSGKTYILTVPGASLATTLQLEMAHIEKTCALDKPLRIHIGHD